MYRELYLTNLVPMTLFLPKNIFPTLFFLGLSRRMSIVTAPATSPQNADPTSLIAIFVSCLVSPRSPCSLISPKFIEYSSVTFTI